MVFFSSLGPCGDYSHSFNLSVLFTHLIHIIMISHVLFIYVVHSHVQKQVSYDKIIIAPNLLSNVGFSSILSNHNYLKGIKLHGIISLLAWEGISGLVGTCRRKMHLQLKFECITKPWHQRLGANAPSLILILEVKLVVDGELEILYEGVYQGDEVDVLMWFVKLGLGHY